MAPIAPKKALNNLSNLVTNKPANAKQALKRTLESSPSNNAIRKRKNAKNVQENQCPQAGKVDPTRTIESKIKKIAISDNKSKNLRAKKLPLVNAIKSIPKCEPKKISDPSKWKDFYTKPEALPVDVSDYDKSQLNNIESEPLYAFDIFQYYRQKEKSTRSQKYMHKQKELSDKMRAVLIDWLVEVQQTFELNHETLYLAVKFIDHFLMKSTISRARFQLLGLTAVFIACKLDERISPIIDDFIYMSDDAYGRDDFISMEIEMLKVLNFNLNLPLSYIFLRRYARCASLSIEILTLARYILESSLMEYSLIEELDSKMAAASLLLALKMKDMKWSVTLEFYSGYKESELVSTMNALNKFISTPNKYMTIKNKYSDQVFYEVAKIKPLPLSD